MERFLGLSQLASRGDLKAIHTQKGTEPPSTAEELCLGEEICASQQGPFAVLTVAGCLTLTPAESTQNRI